MTKPVQSRVIVCPRCRAALDVGTTGKKVVCIACGHHYDGPFGIMRSATTGWPTRDLMINRAFLAVMPIPRFGRL